MADTIKKVLRQAKLDRIKRRRAIAWLLLLSMGTSMGVMWQMHGVGVAATAQYQCGLSEHIHVDGCYPVNVICGQAEGEGHTHEESCFAEEEAVLCGQEEHTHGDECYAMVDELTCPLSSEGHAHGDGCYGEEISYGCGLWEHTHTDACYTESTMLICGEPEAPAHYHDGSCYVSDLGCGLEESEEHSHEDACYISYIGCGLEETDGHTHGDGCYSTDWLVSCGAEDHIHSEDCGVITQQILICGLDEQEPHEHTEECFTPKEALMCRQSEHSHDDSCMSLEEKLVCGLEEREAHSHDYSCFAYGRLNCALEHDHSEECYVKQLLVCGNESDDHFHDDSCWVDFAICGIPEHIHDYTCTSNPEADLETSSLWERTVPSDKLTGLWNFDLLLVARSQIGNGESQLNFKIDENGERQGYTRYGAFYGGNEGAYGEWSAKFVAFCLYYAGIGRDVVPVNGGAYAWYVQLNNAGRLGGLDELAPGSIVFFDLDRDGVVDHVAITYALDDDGGLIVIEGDSPEGMVRAYTYDLFGEDAASIMGVLPLPENDADPDYDKVMDALDTLWTPIETPTETTGPADETQEPEETTEASDPTETTAATEAAEETQEPEETTEASDPTETTAATEATEETTEASDPTETTAATEATEETTEASDPTETTAATEAAEETQAPEEATEASDPTETTAATEATEETTESSDPTETTAATEATEETTEASDPTETTAATEATEETTEATEATEETTEATEETTEATEEPEEHGVLSAYIMSYEDGISLFAMGRMRVMALNDSPESKGGIPLNSMIESVELESQAYEGGSWDSIPKDQWNDVGIEGRSALRFGVNYKVPGGTLSPENNCLKYQMPVAPIKAESGKVYNDAGDVVGVYNFDMQGNVTITFNDEYVQLNQQGNVIEGFFRYKVSTKTFENGNEGGTTFNFGEDQNIVVKDNTEKKLTLDKSTWLDEQNKQLKYTIRISSNKGTVDPIKLEDYLGEGDHGQFTNIKVTKNGQYVASIPDTWNGLDLTLDPLNPGEEYVITYDMPVNEMPADGKITNKATVTSGDRTPDEKEVTIDLPHDLKVNKTGKLAGRQITYTVTIDSPYGTDRSVTVNDAFRNFDYIKDFDVNKVVVKDKSGNVVTPTNPHNTESGFTMELPQMQPGDRYTLTYTVDVDDIPGNNLYIQNTVDASTGLFVGRDDETTTIPQTSLKKAGMVEGDKIRWEITVNQSKQDIGGWTLKDYYNWGEFKVEGATVSPAIIDENGNAVTTINLPYTFPKGCKDTYTIVYYTDSGVASSRPYNRAELTPGPNNPGEGIGSGDVTPPDWEPQNPLKKEGTLLDKAEGAENYIAEWTITIDRGLGEITAPWTFTESLQDRKSWFTGNQVHAAVKAFEDALVSAGLQHLVDGMKITVTDFGWHGKSLNEVPKTDEFTEDGQGKYSGFQVEFNQPLTTDANPIVFKVQSTVPGTVKGAQGDVNVPNMIRVKNAEARTEIKYKPKGDEGDPGKPTPSLEKWLQGRYDANRTNGQIQWGLKMEFNQACKDANCGYTLVDTLPAGVDLVYLTMNPAWSGDRQILPGGGNSGTIPVSMWGDGPYNFEYRIEQVPIDGELRTQISLDVPKEFVQKYNNVQMTVGCDLNSAAGQEYGAVEAGPFVNEAHITKTGEKDILVKVESGHEPITITKKMVYKSHSYGNADNTYQADTIPYKLVVNPLAQDLLPNSNTLTLTDELVFTPSDRLKDISLVADSVKLYMLNSAGVRVRQLSIREAPYTTNRYTDANGQAHREIVWTVPDGMAIEVNYSYKLVGNEGSQVYIGNTAKLTGVDSDYNNDHETTTLKFQESSAGARIKGLSLIKVDAENAALELTGAKFQLEKWSQSEGKYVVVEKNKSGESLAEQLKDGNTYYTLKFTNGRIDLKDLDHDVAYKITEVQAPEGYELPDNPSYEFVLYSKLGAAYSGPANVPNHIGDGSVIRLTNKRNTTGVTVFKISSLDSALLANAQFKLEKLVDGAWSEVRADMTTDGGGRLYIDPIDKDVAYKLTETTAPVGYVLGAPVYFFVPGDGNSQQSMQITVDGQIMTVNSIDSGNVIYVENSPAASLSLKKVDADQKNKVLQGAEFDIYEWMPEQEGEDKYVKLNTDDKKVTTDANGMAQLDDYVTKKNTAYKLVETKAPEGYTLPDPNPSVEFYVKGDGQAPQIDGHELKAYESGGTIEFTNKGKPNMTIEKVDANDVSIKLPGAEFTVYKWDQGQNKYVPAKDANKKSIVVTTGKDGKVLVENLEFDVAYMLKETDTPTGYAKPDHDFEFLIRSSKDKAESELVKPDTFSEKGVILDNGGTMEVKNNTDSHLTLHKQNKDGKPLSGARFRLDVFGTTGFETVKDDLVTDANGQVEIGSYVKEGQVYRLVETKAPTGYQKYPIPSYFKIDRDWFAPTEENVEDLKAVYADNAYAQECLTGQHGEPTSHVMAIRHWYPYAKAIPGDDGTDVKMLYPGVWEKSVEQGADNWVNVPTDDLSEGITVTDYIIENTQVSVTKHWNGDKKTDSVNFDLYRAEIPMNLTAGSGTKKLTVWDDPDYPGVDGYNGDFFESISGYYPEGSEVTFRVYYTHGTWPNKDGSTRISRAYDGDELLTPKEGTDGDLYGKDLRYFTYTVKMDEDKDIKLHLDDNFIDLNTPRWYAEILSVSLTQSTASTVSGGNSGSSGSSSGTSTGEKVTLHLKNNPSYVDSQGNSGNVNVAADWEFEKDTIVTFHVIFSHGGWRIQTGENEWNGDIFRCHAMLNGNELPLDNGPDGSWAGGEEPRYYTYTVTMDSEKTISLNLDNNWDDNWSIQLANQIPPENTNSDTDNSGENSGSTGDNSGSTGETPAKPTVTEGKPLEDLGGTKVSSHTINFVNGKWETINIPDLPLTGYSAKGEHVFYSYYVKETTTGDFRTTYLNNGGITSGEITIVNTPNDIPGLKLLKQSAEYHNGEKIPLKDAEFALIELNEGEDGSWTTGEVVNTFITDEAGSIDLSYEVTQGKTYILRETTPPTGYEIGSNPDYILTFAVGNKPQHKTDTITLDGQQKTRHILGNNYTIKVDNALIKVNVKFRKLDGSNNPLAGAKFTLTQLGSNGEVVKSWPLSSGADGMLYTSHIEFAADTVYRLEETQAPEGYRKSNEVFTFKIDSSWGKNAEAVTQYEEPYGDVTTVPSGYTYTAVNYKKDKPKTQITVEKKWEGVQPDGIDRIEFDIWQVAVTKDWAETGKVWFSVQDETKWNESTQKFEDVDTLGSMKNLTGHFPEGTRVRFRLYYDGTQKPITPPAINDAWSKSLNPMLVYADGQNGIFEYEADVGGVILFDSGWVDNVNDNWTAEIISATVPVPEDRNAIAGTRYNTSGHYDITKNDGWKTTIYDLPASGEVNGKTYYYTYYVVEIPVEGYTPSYSTDENGVQVITNTKKPSYVLPKTGSIGTVPFTAVGLALMLGSIALGAEEIRKSVRRRRNPKP